MGRNFKFKLIHNFNFITMSDVVFRKSLKNKIHSERFQPLIRKKFGFLEKQKYRMQRTRFFLSNRRVIKKFKTKAAERNSDDIFDLKEFLLACNEYASEDIKVNEKK